MFPLNWNIPFIRKNGSRTTLGAITGDIAGIEEDVAGLNEKTDGLWDNMMDNAAVNLLPNNAATTTTNGITFTVNADGTVIVSGTQNSSPVGFMLTTDFSHLENGKTYRVTGANGTSGRTEVFEIRDETAGTNLVEQEAGVAAEFTYDSSHTYKASITLRNNGTTHSTTFKPMFSDPSLNLSYDDYVPYAMTNRELTEEKLAVSVLKTVVAASSDFADFKTKVAAL